MSSQAETPAQILYHRKRVWDDDEQARGSDALARMRPDVFCTPADEAGVDKPDNIE
jgi:hypothetical protein